MVGVYEYLCCCFFKIIISVQERGKRFQLKYRMVSASQHCEYQPPAAYFSAQTTSRRIQPFVTPDYYVLHHCIRLLIGLWLPFYKQTSVLHVHNTNFLLFYMYRSALEIAVPQGIPSHTTVVQWPPPAPLYSWQYFTLQYNTLSRDYPRTACGTTGHSSWGTAASQQN